MRTKRKTKSKVRRITIAMPWEVWRHYKRKSDEERRGVGPQVVVELERAMAAGAGAAPESAKGNETTGTDGTGGTAVSGKLGF